jgi:hypothetical protein
MAEFLSCAADQADSSPAEFAQDRKGRFVYQTLLDKAQSTQEPILQLLQRPPRRASIFHIVNAIWWKETASSLKCWLPVRRGACDR